MSNVVLLVTPSGADEAAQWIARIDEGPLSPADRADLDRWLKRDPQHRQLLDDYARAWSLAATLAHGRVRTWPILSRRRTLGAIAASAVGLVAAVTLLPHSADYSERLATRVGESRTVPLPDGSQMILNTQTEVSVHFDDARRSVVFERGEALFEVAHDPARPFEVRAGTTTARAIGTRFTVRLLGDAAAAVVVTEGRVNVLDAAVPGGTAPGVSLTAGQRAVKRVSEPIVITRLNQAAIERITDWTSGGISFRDEPLSDVLAEVNRYSATPIQLREPALAGLRVSGYFAIGNTPAFVSALAVGAGLRASRASDGTVTLLPA